MRWLLIKDLQILKRSPLLVALLVAYPLLLALLIGLALSRGPEKPRVALFNETPSSERVINIAGRKIDSFRYLNQLFTTVRAVPVSSRQEAIDKVRNGDALGALIIPRNATANVSSGLQSADVDFYYNAEDPLKARLVQTAMKSRLSDANAALTKDVTRQALQYLDAVAHGGKVPLIGEFLGLEKAAGILKIVQRDLPKGSPLRTELDVVIGFAARAQEGLGFSPQVLNVVGQPIAVRYHVVRGGHTPFDEFAIAIAVTVSLMFVALLLAAGTLALEREEGAFPRLVRGLVSRTGLLTEKGLLAAGCALTVAFAMLCGIGLFVNLDWGRFPLWLAALAVGAAGFGAMGLAIGAITREVRAASLLAFMLSLPLAFLALVPSGSVSAGVYDAIRAVSALFPFKPALQLMNAALNGGAMGVAILHLAILTLAFGTIGRLALRRFA
jgi:ABC-type transport system involved in cytochrome c biogenesis permease component